MLLPTRSNQIVHTAATPSTIRVHLIRLIGTSWTLASPPEYGWTRRFKFWDMSHVPDHEVCVQYQCDTETVWLTAYLDDVFEMMRF